MGPSADPLGYRPSVAARTQAAWQLTMERATRAVVAASTLMSRWSGEGGDAVLYAGACLFAVLTGVFAGLSAYRDWAWFAVGPYAAAALASAGVALARGRRRRSRASDGDAASGGLGPARVWILLLTLLGSTLVPLTAEVSLGGGSTTSHVQPEVVVIAQAGHRLALGEDPYHATVLAGGRVVSAVPGEPAFEAFFPYLPLMAAFGLPGAGRGPVHVTSTRVLFSLVTLLVVGVALLLVDAQKDSKMRVAQFLTVLPTAALPLATGGDDMPIVAFLLLAMVLAQRRRPGWSGLVFGIVSAMKFTAWPLAALALFAARDAEGRRRPGRMLGGMVVVAGPVVVPFAFSNLRAFVDNVVLFPMGLVGVPSPAASNLPGHVLATQVHALHVVLPVAIVVLGGAALVHRLFRHPPSTPAAVSQLTGWVMLVAILFAPATRVGYLLYPVDLFVLAWMFSRADAAVREPDGLMAGELGDPVPGPGGLAPAR